MGLKVWSLLTSLIPVLTFQSHPLILSFYPSPIQPPMFTLRRSSSSIYASPSSISASSSLICALRPQRPSSSLPPSLRFNLSISSLRFGYLWICGSVLWVFVLWICGSVLWVCRSSLWVCRSVDFVLQESNHWSLIFALLIFVDFGSLVFVTIYFDRNQLRPPPTRVRSDSTGGFSRSAAGLEFLHPIWSGRLRVGRKPDPWT